MNTTTIASWLLTYLIHSTTLLGAAWLISRILGDRRLALQETLLRTALIGGLLTTTLQIGLNVEPIGGALTINGFSHSETVATNIGAAAEAGASDFAVLPTPAARKRADDLRPTALLSLWGIGSLMALLVLGRSALDLKRLLKTRQIRPAGRLVERLAAAMGLRRSVRLSTSRAIAVPFATGIRQPEICCPERVSDLAIEHQTGLFAHELAHLARRDPAWQLLYRLGEAVLFLQPLNRLVRRRLEEIAEHLTDERAVACTGNRLGLARCLVVVAHWGVSPPPGIHATAFAAGPRLDRRVRHLISGTVGQHHNARWTTPVLMALLVGSVVFLPAIAPSAVHADISATGSDAAPIDTWSVTKADNSDTGSDASPTDTWSVAKTDSDAEEPTPPTPPEAPPATDSPDPVAPVPETAPVPSTAPRSSAPPHPATAPAPSVHPAPAASPESRDEPAPPKAPEPRSEPAPPDSPSAPQPPPRADEPSDRSAPEDPPQRQRERTREEARDSQREDQRKVQRERSEAEARARAQVRALSEERRVLAEQARELTREVAERTRLTDTERDKLRNEARELLRQAQTEAREGTRAVAELSRELAREAAERGLLTEEEMEKMRRHAEVLRAEARELGREVSREARERARALSEKARQLAEEAEAERRTEEERKRREKVE